MHPVTVRRRLQKGWSLQDAQNTPPQNAAPDLINQRFGRLIVLRRAGIKRYASGRQFAQWLCRCDCGTECVATTNALKFQTSSCGCLKPKATSRRFTTHGHTRKNHERPEYRVWASMKDRCFRPQCKAYPHYGGRGITVCERWRASYQNFINDMGARPDGCELDRIDPNGHYEPSNCRWLTHHEQSLNTRANHLRDVNDNPISWAQAADILAVPVWTLQRYVRRAVRH